ncbi:ppiase fkr-5 [Pseudoneurospora amorphoporcata]|uniref:peptidylprolyl isomerase n=1 Tax=Pseudoneurospora amorphoporcata TaxID=241081 RepID=A0AAN6NJL0_9PEZI|nr:ppiase fkr-5 [Pseudoneurospora amorphoporcata]
MKSILLSLSLLASATLGVLAAEELAIDVTVPVECDRKTRKGDKINVHYRGTLQSNGQQFDASYDRGSPFSFKLGGGQVIKGWDEGLIDMCIGEKRTLTVPPSYGYGQRSIGPIPAGSTLIFETELVGIDGVPKPESIVYKKAEEAASTIEEKVAEATDKAGEKIADATEKAEEKVEEASANVAEKVASVVSGAAEAVKTVVADTDDLQEHNEL